MRHAPSIFTMDSAARTSDKYQHISTLQVIDGLRGEGFIPVWAAQCRSRLAHKRAFTKHMLRFRHVDAVANQHGLFPELVLINSHDGLSSYRLMAGVYRMVCSNGLIAGDTYEQVRVRHQGDIVGNVIEGTYQVMDNSRKLIESSDNMARLELTHDERKIFAEAAHAIKFDGETVENTGIKPEQLLKARRYQEIGKNDLFTAFNVIQENALKGGMTGYALDNDGRYRNRTTGERMRKVTTREVKSIDAGTTLNRALWTLAEKMAALKSA